MIGDFIATTQAEPIGAGINPNRKLGWMVRTSLDTGSPGHFQLSPMSHSDCRLTADRRTMTGATVADGTNGDSSIW